MASIDLPRALQDYFAFAETSPTRNGRRFSITLPYLKADGRLERLQWWYHLSAAKEMALGDNASDALRSEAIERFSVHIERWLHNTRQDLYGNGSIPHVSPEGNRLVTAHQVDPSVSQGLEQNGDIDPAGSEHDSSEVEAAEVDGAAGNAEAQNAANAPDVDSAEPHEAGGTTTESGHRPANRSAFG